ncbi:MAG: (2Fe-2S)-binding protein [Porticoccaceae bacterium]|nr:(2Fe-2S)-binding protein [Porticoccaceae bacterium]MBT3799169.1 (2Fe-2S)-binding protein [Porticoccaceae bacterium]MBT4163768.1 (2Fe-2S)-binding protein [Porticoccaceae bacterium]MBT4210495.1 (2Fe-2S)-binding protein [Porticoccaceae bacterium]MBT4592593.1 (2Fe-2S)-binding protein [Porticoccaceae bacterium]
MAISLKINGENYSVDAEPDTPLLWAIRDHVEMTGTKFGCGIASCGACTVHLNGEAVRSCVMQIGSIGDQEITTIEGLDSREVKAIQAAWDELAVVQCGYCQSGQIMSATALLKKNPTPNDADIDTALSGNICRCATYTRIRNAVKYASHTISVKEI